jgi:GNAT superfamily N-acetyltransferase
MEEPVLRTAYWHDPAARQAFKDFIVAIHQIDFEDWDRLGYWDDDYSPYSYFIGDQVVASACIYTMPAIVNGEACTVAQVSGVGTLPEYRNRGLARRLHEIALAEALPTHRFAFLFSDEDAIGFYRKCGFSPVSAHAAVVPLPAITPSPDARKLDTRDPAVLDAIFRLASVRAPASQVFSTANPKLVIWHLLYRLRDHAWSIPSLDAVVLMKRHAERTIVYDVLARRMPTFEQLAPYLAGAGAREAEFRFPVDALGVPSFTLRELPGYDAHVMGPFDLGPQPVFPFTSQA